MKEKKNELIALGKVLRNYRESARHSQEKLAEIVDIHRTYIGGIERGERNPTFNNINRILMALDISWELFGESIDKELNLKK